MSAEKKQDINQLGKFRYPEIALANARIVELEAQIASAQQQEPVLYQWKWKSDDPEVELLHSWHSCDKFVFEKYSSDKKHSQYRKLYAEPVMPQIAMPAASVSKQGEA